MPKENPGRLAKEVPGARVPPLSASLVLFKFVRK